MSVAGSFFANVPALICILPSRCRPTPESSHPSCLLPSLLLSNHSLCSNPSRQDNASNKSALCNPFTRRVVVKHLLRTHIISQAPITSTFHTEQLTIEEHDMQPRPADSCTTEVTIHTAAGEWGYAHEHQHIFTSWKSVERVVLHISYCWQQLLEQALTPVQS
jgi:hypothetical protein